ncbi:MAG: glutamate synthase subunit beta [Candidatus Omnitrophota bacterium]|nr:glutamate synthase subunit beta [Candidatus Omnitrophota bacterium]
MGDVQGFLKVKRQAAQYRLVCERKSDYQEVILLRGAQDAERQASRCMDCGTPFCHWGCPVGNYIPEWNDLVYHKQWQKAFQLLEATNNFPEFTGRLCPALCEYSCVLGINDDPVTIRENELNIIESAFSAGAVKPQPPQRRTGKEVVVIGSGPAGMACADQLNQAGHLVIVFERDDQFGGLLRYGIPDFKLPKSILNRRLEILQREGIVFVKGMNVDTHFVWQKLKQGNSAVCLATGSRVPRDLKIKGRELAGIHFALDYLRQANIRAKGGKIAPARFINAKGKNVVVIGGGDTGADCVGVAHRQGAQCVAQIELLAKPPECRTTDYPWPKYPLICKSSTSHEEGGIREWAVSSKRFLGRDGRVEKLICQRMEGKTVGSEFEIATDLVILAMGFLHPEHQGIVQNLGLELDPKGNVQTDEDYMTSAKGVFSAGDMRRGQSLVVWAISEGRRAAYHIDRYLMGKSSLPEL